MSFFSRKPKIRYDEFCLDFYDNHILKSPIQNIDFNQIYIDTVKKSIVDLDSSFANVATQKLRVEMTILRFELFGLSWLHELGDKLAPKQSSFTKDYLKQKGLSNIWDSMGFYNQAIAKSATYGLTSDTPSGRAQIVFNDSFRLQLFEKWCNQNYDPKCVARAVNRILTDNAWKNNITPSLLMLTFCNRLECDVNENAKFGLTATIVGLYNGARESLQEVNITS